MADDIVNQLTLNFLISKSQLQKLNKKIKDDVDENRKTDKEIYEVRIKKLFSDLLVNEPPDDLLHDVKIGFDHFLDKCIYYLKAHDNNKILEKERSHEIIHDDIDFEKEERAIERGNYEECSDRGTEEDEENSREDEENSREDEENSREDEENSREDEENSEETIDDKPKIEQPIIVNKKYKKSTNSVGVEDIQKLPLDWFQNVRQNYKANQIIPRKKEQIFDKKKI
jgi:hypothetical protein